MVELIITKPISNPSNADLRAVGLRNTSGLYFMLRPTNEVIYIGKATKGNLHDELWGKLKTPEGEIPSKYPNTYWSKMQLEPEVSRELMDGDLLVAAFAVEPSICCSLLEVYLQTLCSSNEELPSLNSQIG